MVSQKFKEWLKKKSYKDVGEKISRRIPDDKWWEKVEVNIAVCSPVVTLLRLVDESRSIIGKIYFKMFKVREELKSLENIDQHSIQQVIKFFDLRWKTLHTDMHYAGYVLDPEYNLPQYSQATNAEVMNGFLNTGKNVES